MRISAPPPERIKELKRRCENNKTNNRSMRNLRILGGYQNTKDNKEDLAITPYLFSVKVNIETTKKIRVYGIGICWIHYSFYIGIGINVPRIYPSFRNSSKKL